jgi:hypothetical protein
MGSILSTLPLHEIDELGKLSPKSAHWLTSHADATGLAVVEVERLWTRFKQLTGSDDERCLNINSTTNELSSDIFARNVS